MRNFWKHHRIWVTGGAGFLGSHLMARLLSCGADVVTLRSAECDLRLQPDVIRALKEIRPTIVIHAAASVGGIEANSLYPADFIYDNLAMGTHLIHETYCAGVDKLVTIGTVCAYPKFTPVPFREADLWDGYPEETNAPYGIAKRALMVQGQAYRRQYGFNVIHLIPTNLYGPRDNFSPQSSHVIPALIRRCLIAKHRGERELVVWGTGNATREFLYVKDAVDAILKAVELYNGEQPINIGTGIEISIKTLVELIAQHTGFEGQIVWDMTKPDGQPRRSLDTSNAKALFGFEAQTPFVDGLIRTIEWAIENRVGAEEVVAP